MDIPALVNVWPATTEPSPTVKQFKADPKLVVVAEANDLATKYTTLQMIMTYSLIWKGRNYKVCLAKPDRQAHEAPFTERRMDDIREYERTRYATLYMQKALDVREKMLERVPDLPMLGLNTSEARSMYMSPFNSQGFRRVASNLRELAKAYQLHQ
jgi:hypothetical protein